MTPSLFRWLVYRAALPLDGRPAPLGELEASTLAAAKNLAAKRWPGVATLIQSAASARVRPVSAIPLDVAANRQTRVAPKKRGKYSKSKQQLDAFCAAKRAAHAATKRDSHSRTDR